MNKLKKWACRFWAMLFVGCFAANLVAQDDFVAIEIPRSECRTMNDTTLKACKCGMPLCLHKKVNSEIDKG